jgi:hypothetical protein
VINDARYFYCASQLPKNLQTFVTFASICFCWLRLFRQNLSSDERRDARVMVTISDISFEGGGQHTPPYAVIAELPSLEDRESSLINLHSFLFCSKCIIFDPAVH